MADGGPGPSLPMQALHAPEQRHRRPAPAARPVTPETAGSADLPPCDAEPGLPEDSELQVLLHLAERLLAAPDAPGAAREVLDSVVGGYGIPRAVLLAAPDGGLTVLASHGLASALPPAGPCDSAAVRRALDTGSVVLLRSLALEHEPWLTELLPPAVDLLVVPVTAGGRRFGALVLQLPVLREPAWHLAIVPALERAAACLARSLRTLWRVQQLERLAATDDLTMIANRRSFMSSLERELARSTRSGEPVTLVILDLDGFKAVNDEHGHPAGDEALRNVAAALTIVCRDLDTPARYGGEEFAVILPDCGPSQGMEIAERLRAAVRAAPAVTTLTASAGVATFPQHGRDVDTLVRVADDALLTAKRGGRNRTVQGRLTGEISVVDAVLRLDDAPGAQCWT
jgi:diguanylate cyclase (GGDEF)-like protein